MAKWDWDSSDIGDMTPESFGDDYYYTGGKFTDWSGESAGKFDEEKPSYWDESDSDDSDEDCDSDDDSSDSSWDGDSSDNDY